MQIFKYIRKNKNLYKNILKIGRKIIKLLQLHAILLNKIIKKLEVALQLLK